MAIGIVCGALGCRQILGIEPGSVRDDAMTGDVLMEDAPEADAMIDAPSSRWQKPQLVMGLANGDQDPTLTGDLLELYFTRGTDVMFMTRADVNSPWSPVSTATFPMGAGTDDQGPELTAEGLFLLFTSDRGPGDNYDIYYVARATRTGSWSMPEAITELNSNAGADRPGSTTTSGDRIVITSDRSGSTGLDLYEAIRPGLLGTPYDPPVRMPINTAGDDGAPFLSLDGLTLYYAASPLGLGQRDLYVSTRTSLAEQFTIGTPIDELNTQANDSDPWVSPDGREIYFFSNRDGAGRIYRAIRD
jgi:hypothetical protein